MPAFAASSHVRPSWGSTPSARAAARPASALRRTAAAHTHHDPRRALNLFARAAATAGSHTKKHAHARAAPAGVLLLLARLGRLRLGQQGGAPRRPRVRRACARERRAAQRAAMGTALPSLQLVTPVCAHAAPANAPAPPLAAAAAAAAAVPLCAPLLSGAAAAAAAALLPATCAARLATAAAALACALGSAPPAAAAAAPCNDAAPLLSAAGAAEAGAAAAVEAGVSPAAPSGRRMQCASPPGEVDEAAGGACAATGPAHASAWKARWVWRQRVRAASVAWRRVGGWVGWSEGAPEGAGPQGGGARAAGAAATPPCSGSCSDSVRSSAATSARRRS